MSGCDETLLQMLFIILSRFCVFGGRLSRFNVDGLSLKLKAEAVEEAV